ncbi:FAD-dependent oxidoreductase [Actinoplanes sp. OR16]|uniref:FAD-dependent monooxygenase n=1 Tax=Actinoplanes sp. OR16 TaxID=946334 RepID=UPI000F6D0FC2|nr:FAD-dependent monooxygenase [Actinoplanes sp. OR16]BBH71805.1 FAD-dependent oxidoreductase [Actinoplanes sp. OR16]
MPTPALRTPVLVAGAGVTGALTALELAHHGVPSMVIERAGGSSRFPDPMLISGRGMELLRRLGLNRPLRAEGMDPSCPVDVLWSREAGRPAVPVWRLPAPADLRQAYATSADGTAPIEPYLLINGPVLITRLRRSLHEHPLIDLRTRWTLTDVRADDGAVTTTVIDAAAGSRHVIESAYLAGCDGTESTVRRCAGVGLQQLGPSATRFTVYFRSPALTRTWRHPSVLITHGATVTGGHDGDSCVAHLRVTADDQDDVGDPGALLHHRLGLAHDPPQVMAVVQRTGAPSIARAYRQGRIFLAGRAGHQAGAPGGDVDLCIGDAVDLGWRLAATLHGWAGERLLAGYEDERRRDALADQRSAKRVRRTRARLDRLAESGADQDAIVDALRKHAPRLDPGGTGPAEMAGTTGHRSPAFPIAGGGQLFDRLGPQFTLADLTADQNGWPLVTAARTRGIPVRHLPIAGTRVPAAWPGRLVLIRPDQRVAWSADDLPADCDRVLSEVTGSRPVFYENT